MSINQKITEDFTIIVDTKEPLYLYESLSIEITTNPKYKQFANPKRESLPCGDFKFRSLGMERKDIHDFVASIHDGRIFNQAFKMSENYTHLYFLVSGNINDTLLKEKDLKGVYTVIADLEQRYGARFIFFPNDAFLVYYVAKLCLKVISELKPLYTFHKKHPSVNDEQIEVLCGIYKCGPKKAKKLLTRYNTIQGISTALEFDLQDTVGEKLGSHIYEILHQEYDSKHEYGEE